MNIVHLPYLQAIRLSGFQPVFTRDFSKHIQPGLNIVLGGNGLGKTTTMQAIIFALTGGASAATEPNTSFRWNQKWFYGRIDEMSRRSANVEVDFAIGHTMVSIRRSFRSPDPTGLNINNELWITSKPAVVQRLNEVLSTCGYRSYDDFCFVVLRLLYLSENRRLLAWDADAQSRILMLLNPQAIDERRFRGHRERITLTDTRKRHAHVNIGKLEKIAQEKRAVSDQPLPIGDVTNLQLSELLKAKIETLRNISASKRPLEQELERTQDSLNVRALEVEALRDQVDDAELSLVAEHLHKAGTEGNLPLAKLLEFGTCPCCGTYQPALQQTARQFQNSKSCLICGNDEEIEAQPQLSSLQSQLAQKLTSQQELELLRRRAASKIETLTQQEAITFAAIAKLRVDLESASEPVYRNLPTSAAHLLSLGELTTKLHEERKEEDSKAVELEVLQKDIKSQYSDFRKAIADRTESLKNLYEHYASKFLGVECTLIEAESSHRLFMPQRLVPRFNGVIRETPESCSEAQQFFLDIAFRMATMDLAKSHSGAPSTFLCETPENALDFSYVENVASMFKSFADGGHATILTANIQRNGLASQLIATWPRSEDRARLLELLELGHLSEVQERKLDELKRHSRGAR